MDYINISQTIGIDTLINKKLLAASAIFKHVRKGEVLKLANLHNVDAEVLDKITILEIKSERIKDADKVANVKRELELLSASWLEAVEQDDSVRRIHAELKTINEALWEIEDDIRDKERAREFDQVFIDLARSVYVTNDQRANAKKELNIYLGSEIVEEKSYQDYS